MPNYDRQCEKCQKTFIDCLEPMNAPMVICACGGDAPRIFSSKASVIGDEIPGGIMIEHGICNPDGSPKRYDTKSSIHEAAKKAGLVVGAFMHEPPRGRSYPVISVLSEEERLRHWREHEETIHAGSNRATSAA